MQAFQNIFENISSFFSQISSAGWLETGLQMIMRIMLAVFAIWVVERCARSIFRFKVEREVWGSLTDPSGKVYYLLHWENTIGRSKRCDVVLSLSTISRDHAVLQRSNDGQWYVTAIHAKNGVFVNKKEVPSSQRQELRAGDILDVGGLDLTFQPITQEQERLQAERRTKPGRAISPIPTLLLLTLFQLSLYAQLLINLGSDNVNLAAMSVAFGGLCLLMWLMFFVYRMFRRRGFELETLAFFLTTLCMGVTASTAPDSLYTQLVALVIGLVLFFLLAVVLRSLNLALKLRWVAAALAGVLLCATLIFGSTISGERNWISIGSFSFQPSELVKLAFILIGATTLERMFARRNLIFTLLFSAFCVGCLALMSDFGSAVIFFMVFLAVAFLRSGDLPSIAFMSCGAVLAAFLIIQIRPYVATRFSVYLHVWEDSSGYGYQQTRTLSALASGGLFGNGAGNGWLKNVGAANTDLVFGVVAEELGLIIACTAVAVILIFAIVAIRYAATARSTFYVIAACSTGMLLVVQTMLNVFGSTDLLPLTGVTFPFVSCGGSSMVACWGLLAYIKAADTRQNAGLSIPLPRRRPRKAKKEKQENPQDNTNDKEDTQDLTGVTDETKVWKGGNSR